MLSWTGNPKNYHPASKAAIGDFGSRMILSSKNLMNRGQFFRNKFFQEMIKGYLFRVSKALKRIPLFFSKAYYNFMPWLRELQFSSLHFVKMVYNAMGVPIGSFLATIFKLRNFIFH